MLALLVKITDYGEVKALLHYIFIVALNTFQGNNLIYGNVLECDISKNYLRALISGYDVNVELEENESDFEEVDSKDHKVVHNFLSEIKDTFI